MGIFIPIVCFVLGSVIVRNFSTDLHLSRRESWLAAFTVLGVWVYADTEILSLTDSISFNGVFISWGILSFFLVLLFFSLVKKRGNIGLPKYLSKGEPVRSINQYWQESSAQEKCLLGMTFFILLATGILAYLVPSNNYDSMTYHMSRVVHWVQNKNVGFYPTIDYRQLVLAPWSEYTILHFQILDQSDRWANFVQWFCMVMSLAGVSLLCRQWGADRKTQWLSVFLAATLPMGILQGSSTQTDYAVCCWVVIFIYFSLKYRKSPSSFYLLIMGGSLGLAVLTKGTAYFFLFPFVFWHLFSELRDRRGRFALSMGILVVCFFAINGPHYFRSYQLYGTPLYAAGNTNTGMSPALFLSNCLKNLFSHCDLLFARANQGVVGVVEKIHLFLNVPMNDPRVSYEGMGFSFRYHPFCEDNMANLMHTALIFLCLFVFFFTLRGEKKKSLRSYTLMVLAGFVLFCLMIQWSPWNTRYHLTLFILCMPVTAIVINQSRLNTDFFRWVVISFFMGFSLMCLAFNRNKTWVGKDTVFNTTRREKYFLGSPGLKEPFLKTIDYINALPVSTIGLVLEWNSWEYPFWVGLYQHQKHYRRLEHIRVNNPSKVYSAENFIPEIIIDTQGKQGRRFFWKQGWYVQVKQFSMVRIYQRKEGVTAPLNQ